METLFAGVGDAVAPLPKKPKSPIIITREAWLLKAADIFHPRLDKAGAGPRPKYRVSVGWPLGGRAIPKKTGGSHRIGECFSGAASKDGTSEIFISPLLDEPVLVLATLLHELVHAYVGVQAKHGPIFRKVAVATGLEGKMTATIAGAVLKPELILIAKRIGEFPHRELRVGENPLKPKQGTRMLKLECPACGYSARTTRKWLDVGVPTCVCGTAMVGPEDDGEEENDAE